MMSMLKILPRNMHFVAFSMILWGFTCMLSTCTTVEAKAAMQPAFSTFIGPLTHPISRANSFGNFNHMSQYANSRSRRNSFFRMSASMGGEGAAEGDKLLAKAATALASGNLNEARGLLVAAKVAYQQANVHDRESLLQEVSKRVDEAGARAMRQPTGMAGAGLDNDMSKALLRSKQKGDDLMAKATAALGRRDINAAKQLVEEARETFEQAGPAVARDREMILGNLRSSVMIEEERQLLAEKRERKRAKEEAEQRMMFEQSLNPPWLPGTAGNQASIDTFLEDVEDEDQSIDGMEQGVCILVDNGSSRAASTLSLRAVAQRLQQRIGTRVVPASLKHSDKAPVSELGGEPAVLFESLVRAMTSEGGLRNMGRGFEDADGVRDACVLPMFFGPSGALTALVPQDAGSGQMNVRLAKHLGAGEEGVRMIAGAMMREVRAVIDQKKLVKPPVILVDHGSPSRDVVALRDAVAAELRREAVGAGLAASVRAASMERKPGEEYAFADPLLEVALRDLVAAQRLEDNRGGKDAQSSVGPDSEIDLVLVMMFLGPGTHAGEGGDIDRICAGVKGVRVHRTRLFGQCEGLVDILEMRYREALEAE